MWVWVSSSFALQLGSLYPHLSHLHTHPEASASNWRATVGLEREACPEQPHSQRGTFFSHGNPLIGLG